MGTSILVLQLSSADFEPPWWQLAGSAVLATIIVLNLFGSRRLPIGVLSALWAVFPAIITLMGILWLAPSGQPFPQNHRPWPWGMEAVSFCYLSLLVRRPSAILLYPMLINLTPLASALFFAVPVQDIPKTFAADTPVLTTFIGFAFFFVVLRSRHRVFERSREDLLRAESDQAEKIGEAERRREFSLLVHDHVLAVFSAAMLLPDTESSELRAAARTATRVIAETEAAGLIAPLEDTVPTGQLSAEWRSSWLGIDPHTVILAQDLGGEVPANVAAAVGGAVSEALRNSMRHAGSDATRTIQACLAGERIDISVRDNGPGFELEAISQERLGVRYGILERIERVGGSVIFSYEEGSGMEMRITWVNRD